MVIVKTTVEIPDALLRRAKATAAQQSVSLQQFLIHALRQQLPRTARTAPSPKPWMKAFGGLRDLHRENKRIDRIIREEFERIDRQSSVL